MSCKLNEKTNRCSKTGTKETTLCVLNKETNRCIKNNAITEKKPKNKSTKAKVTKVTVKASVIPKKTLKVKKVIKTKPAKAPKASKAVKDRRSQCILPEGLEYVSQLGERGKEGETWKVKDTKKGQYYALKIFDSKKSKKNIDIEIDYQQRLNKYNVSPNIVWVPKDQKCFMMELIGGKSLQEYSKTAVSYTEEDVRQLYNIVIALYKSKVGYNDGNVKMNMMITKDRKWRLIDYGMVMNEKKVITHSKKEGITVDEYYLVNGFNIILKVEEYMMKRLYKRENYKYTPLGGVYNPSHSFPSLMKYVFSHGLEDKIPLLRINKRMFYGPHKKYDESKRLGQ
jgi:predicted Ser/Thr protein kinase